MAFNILPPGLTDDPQYSERFKQEAKSMVKLGHVGIVAVFDAGELANGMLYFVMEFIEGTDVQKMIAVQGSLPPDHAMAVSAHVCDALQYAHDLGIIHRNIKPANIRISYDGVMKVADLGLAKQQQEGASGLTQSGMVARPQRPQGYVQRSVQPVPKKSSSTSILLVAVLVLAAGGFFVFKDKLRPASASTLSVTAETSKADPATPAAYAEEAGCPPKPASPPVTIPISVMRNESSSAPHLPRWCHTRARAVV